MHQRDAEGLFGRCGGDAVLVSCLAAQDMGRTDIPESARFHGTNWVMADFGQTDFGQTDFGQPFWRPSLAKPTLARVSVLVVWPTLAKTNFGQTDFDDNQRAQTCTFEGPSLQKHQQNSTRRHPEKERILRREKEKKRNFGPPTLRALPLFLGLGPHPSGPHFFWVWAPTLRAPTFSG